MVAYTYKKIRSYIDSLLLWLCLRVVVLVDCAIASARRLCEGEPEAIQRRNVLLQIVSQIFPIYMEVRPPDIYASLLQPLP